MGNKDQLKPDHPLTAEQLRRWGRKYIEEIAELSIRTVAKKARMGHPALVSALTAKGTYRIGTLVRALNALGVRVEKQYVIRWVPRRVQERPSIHDYE